MLETPGPFERRIGPAFFLRGLRRFLGAVSIYFIAANNSTVAMAVDAPVPLSLNDAVRMGVEKNLEVRAELYTPAQYEAEVNRNRAIYDPRLNFQISYSDTTSPEVSSETTFSSRGHSFQLLPSVSQLFWTGATATLAFNNTYSSGDLFAMRNGNNWQSGLGLTLSQPLLKNAGREATELAIAVSRFSKFASLEHFKLVLLDTVARIRNEYFTLYGLCEQLEVRKGSLALSRKILSDTRVRVKAGVLPAMEILNAEYGVTTREKDLIEAERIVSDQIDALRLLLQLNSGGGIVPSDRPRQGAYRFDQDAAMEHALSRPDIKELKRTLDVGELQARVLGNNIRPDLTLNLTGSLVGQDHSYGRDLERIARIDYPAWGVGFTFTYPLGNNAAENDYRKIRLKNAQTALQIRSLEQSAMNDVKNSIRLIASSYKQLEVAERSRTFAEERLRAFMRRNEAGLVSTKDVLEVEADLVMAKNNQITAAVAYDNAITRHWQVTGELLEREQIRFVEGDADKLYGATR